MTDRPPLADRTDQQITDDVCAALMLVSPLWVRCVDPPTLPLWVRDQLDELEADARSHGRAETGCMVVEYDADESKRRRRVQDDLVCDGARSHGRAETGCMVVEYDADECKMTWSVTVGCRFDEDPAA